MKATLAILPLAILLTACDTSNLDYTDQYFPEVTTTATAPSTVFVKPAPIVETPAPVVAAPITIEPTPVVIVSKPTPAPTPVVVEEIVEVTEVVVQIDEPYWPETTLEDVIVEITEEVESTPLTVVEEVSAAELLLEEMLLDIEVEEAQKPVITVNNPIKGTRQSEPGGLRWADSYSVNDVCFIYSTLDHNAGDLEWDTQTETYGVLTVRDILNMQTNHPLYEEFDGSQPIYNDVQCGWGPGNDFGDEDHDGGCPARVDIGRAGCDQVGPQWSFDY